MGHLLRTVRRGSREPALLVGLCRLWLLLAVVFWWGAVVVPNLISLAFPEWLPADALPRDLDPDVDLEGRLANRVSAVTLLVLAILALATAEASRRRGVGWIAVGGWTALGGTAAYLAWEEESEFHVANISLGLGKQIFGVESQYIWVIVLSPLIAVFVLVMLAFISKGRQLGETRRFLTLGMSAWLLVLLHEVSVPYLFARWLHGLEVVFEESMEFGGALIMCLAAIVALRERELGVFRSRVCIPLVIGSLALVGLLGCLFVACVFRAPVLDARAQTHVGTFDVSLSDSQAVAQEFRLPAVPLAGLGLRLGVRDPDGTQGAVIWRIVDSDGAGGGSILRAGSLEIDAGKSLHRTTINFPPLTQPEGRPLILIVQADLRPAASLLVGATKTDGQMPGRLWINGDPGWPDQKLDFVAYGAPEPTRSKLQGVWLFLTSNWRWPVLAADAAPALTLMTLLPILLMVSALNSAFWRIR